MAKIIPFKAVRPAPDKVNLVTSRSYNEYSAAELASQLDINPVSFLHILNPAYTNQQKLAIKKRFKLVKKKYQEFRSDTILVQDDKPAVYIHQIATENHTFTGIILGTSIEDYQNNVIKKHENTLQYRVELLKDYMKFSGFNTEPVLMTYPENEMMNNWITEKTKLPADFDFITTRKDTHYLWKIEDEKEILWLQETFATIDSLYIADGHHRSASAEMLYEEKSSSIGESGKYFMSFLIAESNVKIYEYNRLIKDLNNLTPTEFLEKLSNVFQIELKNELLFLPAKKHQLGMYLKDQFYLLTLKEEKGAFKTVLDRLDAEILYRQVLSPILGIEDLQNDKRIDYISGKQPIIDIKTKIDEGEFELGFFLFPSDISEIKAIADADLIMPPKSTYIEPKFRSGLVVYELTP